MLREALALFCRLKELRSRYGELGVEENNDCVCVGPVEVVCALMCRRMCWR